MKTWIPYQRAKPDFMYDQLTDPGGFVRKSRSAFLGTSVQLAGNGVALGSKIQIAFLFFFFLFFFYEPLRYCIEPTGHCARDKYERTVKYVTYGNI